MIDNSVMPLGTFVDAKEISLQTGPFGTQLKASDYVDSGIPVINVRNIGFGSIIEDKLEYITEETRNRLSSHVLSYQDIVFGRKGAVERHVFINDKCDGWFQGSDCIRMRVNSNRLVPRYLSYCLLTPLHQQWMQNHCSHGATMASLNQDIIKLIPIRVHDYAIQEKIVAVLSKYDNLIENNNRRIAILEEMAQRLYREWFVHFRFPGHEDVKMVESAFGMIPEGWEVGMLSKIADIVMGQSPASTYYNELGEGLPFHQGVTNFTSLIPEHKLFSTAGNRIAEKNDILFSVRAPVGRINIADRKIILGRGVSAIRKKNNHQAFLLFLLRNNFDKLDAIGNGAIFNSVTKDDMHRIKLLIPNAETEERFNSIIEPVVKLLITLSKKNTILRKTRDHLLPRLISGDIDVSDLPIKTKED